MLLGLLLVYIYTCCPCVHIQNQWPWHGAELYSLFLMFPRQLSQNGLLFECCSDPREVHRLLPSLWAQVRPLVCGRPAGRPHAAFRQRWHEPGASPKHLHLCTIYPYLLLFYLFDPVLYFSAPWSNHNSQMCRLCRFLLVQAHLPQHHRPVPPHGQAASCRQHPKVYPCRRQAQRPGRCG